MAKWADKVRKNNTYTPKIGVVHSSTSTDPNETSYGKKVRPALEETGGEYVELDFRTIPYHFFKKQDGTLDNQRLDVYISALLAAKKIDAIFLPGNWYNMVAPNVNPDKSRTWLEESLIRISRTQGIPLIGVCGGAQHYGHYIGAQITNDAEALTGYSHAVGDISTLAHQNIITAKDSIYFGAYKHQAKEENGQLRIWVNSLHKQGIINTPENVEILKNAGLRVVVLDQSGKLIEGLESIHGAPVILVQDHPEGLQDKPLIRAFIDASRAYALKKQAIAEASQSQIIVATFFPKQPQTAKTSYVFAEECRANPLYYSMPRYGEARG